jgi:hypothetical protein
MYEHEQKARDFLETAPDKYQAELSRADCHGTDVALILPREIPTGFLGDVGGQADLRIEGIRQDTNQVEAVLQF